MSTANKLTYLNGTKQAIKQAINEDFEVIDNNTTFREYADEISSNNAKYKDLIPKETTNATNTLDISNSSGLDKALVTQYGNTYQEGEPTPDTPQEIVNISGKSTLKDVGKNLFDKDNTNIINAYINISVLKAAGKSGGSFYIPCEPNTTYTVSKTELFGNDRFCVFDTYRIPTAGDTILSYVGKPMGGNSDTSLTITTNATATYLGIFIKAGETSPAKTFQEIADTIQVEKGTASSDYEPYQEQSFDLDLPFELCKILDYKDRMYPLNGKWYLEKKIGKVVLDGNEEWNSETAYTGYYRYILSTLGALNSNNGLNNRFTQRISQAHGGYEYLYIQTNNGAIHIQLLQSRLSSSSIADFKTWLSNNNVTVYYVLATPTTEEITESNYPTLYNQLNNIKLFEGVNHITMTNESGLDVEFDIEYYKDWKLD